jgi:branched-chain amino acid aminotransferase
MVPPYSIQDITEGCKELVRQNSHGAAYIRPMVLRGYGTMTLDPTDSPIETWIASWAWGANPLTSDAAEKGVDATVSSWHRAAPDTFPAVAKAGGNYLSAQLIKRDAVRGGYAESIALGTGGIVSEGSGQNVFLVKDGVLLTPLLDGTSLAGITRDSVMRIAKDMGVPVKEQPVPREMLYVVDEVFFSGTATEVIPVRSVDKIPVGAGKAGPITLELRRRFLDIVTGKNGDPYGWLTYTGDR